MKNRTPALWLPIVASLTIAVVSPAWANPTGENVISGMADFNRAGSELTVTQHTQNAIVNWQDFSIGEGELTRFMQPQGGAILNRVVGNNPSAVYGTLQATGQVFLINQHGIVVGPNGVVNAAGGFVGSTLDIEDQNFANGGNLNFAGATPGPVKNLGTIKSANGDVVLLGQEVRNEGTISAGGDAVLAAGSALVLKPAGSNRVAVLAGSAAGTLENSGLVEGANAELLANGGNAGALAINTTGIVRATGVQNKDGRLILSGGEGDVTVAGQVEATRDENGGDITITGKRILVDENTTIAANGANGGTIKLGGGREGKDASVPNAERLYIAQTAKVSADGTAGNGGEVIAYSKLGTQSYGSLLARGTAKGGFIETSGGWLDLGNNVPDVSGGLLAGTWLIDPYNIEIVAGGGNVNVGTTTPFNPTNDNAQIGVNLITAGLVNGNVVISTGSGGAQAGDITLNTDLNFNGIGAARTLTFTAARNVVINNRIYDSAAGGESLNVVLDADNDNNGLGAAIIRANISTGGGNITSNRATYMAGGSALTLDSGTGNMTFTGQTKLANNNGVTLSTNGGTILFSNALDSGNSYVYDATQRTWQDSLAAVRTGTGANTGDTYLATLTSALENSIAQSTLPGGISAWLGGSDNASEGVWRWVAGPEGLENGGAGRQFWQGAFNGHAVNGQYSNWTPGTEPNNSSGSENALQIGFGAGGEWNDFPHNSTQLGSVVETNQAPTNLTVNLGTNGTVTFNGVVGAEKELGNLTVNSGGTANFNHNFTSAGTVDVHSAAAFGGADRTLMANALVFRNQVNGTANNVWRADSMDLQDAINFTGQTLHLVQRTNGRAVRLASGPGAYLDLSGAELGRITAANVRVGNGQSGALTVDDTVNMTNGTNLLLQSGSNITDTANGLITASGLGIRAGAPSGLARAHNAGIVAIHVQGNASYNGAGGYTIGAFDDFATGAYSSGILRLNAGGTVNQTSALTPHTLELAGSNANYQLTHADNSVDTLYGETGTINYFNSGALTASYIYGNLTGTGQVQVRTGSGNLTMGGSITGGGGGNSVILAAGGAFRKTSANNHTINVGNDGRYLIYSNTPANTQLGNLAPGSRYYNHTFAGNAAATIGGTDNRVLYSYVPVLTFTAQNANHVYGSPNYTYVVTGFESGDHGGTAYSGMPTFVPASTNVGTHVLNINGTGLSNLQGYAFNFVAGQTVITPAALTIIADSFTRQMNQPNPELTATFAGLVNGDTKSAVSGLTLTTTALPGSPMGGYAIKAANGASTNYTITYVDGVLTVKGLEAADKVIEHLQVVTDMPTTQQQNQLKIVAATPESMNVKPSQGGTVRQAVRGTTMPQVGVETASLAGNTGSTGAESGAGDDALAQTSTLDVIAEQGEKR